MPVYRRTIAREQVRLNHLPWPELESRFDRWVTHVKANEGSIIGLDCETTAIDEVLGPFQPDMICRLIQFGSHREAFALDPHDEFWRAKIIGLLEDPDIRFVSHTNYDPLWISREFGIALSDGDRIIDTIVIASLLFPGITRPKDLKSLTSSFIDDGLSAAQTELFIRFRELAFDRSKLPKSFVDGESNCRTPKCDETSYVESLRGLCELHHYEPVKLDRKLKMWGFTHVPIDDVVFAAYAGLDAIYVRRLLDELSKMIKGKTKSLSRREQRIARLATDMRVRGLRVDPDWTASLLDDVEAEFNAADARLEELWGFPRYSPKRGDWLLDHGARFTEATPSGMPKLTMPSAASQGTLPDLVERYASDELLGPVFDDMLTLGTHKNFLQNLRIIIASAANDGRAHPEIKTQAAHTGRMSIIKPALQTLKKRDPRLRGCFVADPGHVLVGADYASQEIRIAAAYSRDKALLRIVREDLNQHLLTCESIFGVADKTTLRREGQTFYDCAKTLDFASAYGAGPRRIAEQLDISLDEATTMWTGWRDTYSGLVSWNEEIAKAQVVVNPWGRRIPTDQWGRGYANSNYAIQGSGRDVLGDAIIALDDAGWGDALWLFIHDEIILHVHEDEADEAAAVLTECMSTRFRDIELPAVGKVIGQRWGTDD